LISDGGTPFADDFSLTVSGSCFGEFAVPDLFSVWDFIFSPDVLEESIILPIYIFTCLFMVSLFS